jgi:hypothetical protein
MNFVSVDQMEAIWAGHRTSTADSVVDTAVVKQSICSEVHMQSFAIRAPHAYAALGSIPGENATQMPLTN